MNVGEYIKTLRLSKGLSQEELGKVLGVQRAAVQKWEVGRVQNLKRDTIKKLAEYFGVSPASFFTDEKETTPPLDSEIVSAFQNLSEDQQEQVLNFIKFLSEGNG